MTRVPFLATLIAALLLVAAPASPALAGSDGTNVAEAVNDEDGSSVIDIAFDIRRVSSGVVDQTNVAAAYATCETCQTVAIAIQIVLVSGDVDSATPTNVAVALNEGCNACQTMALAYQFVFGNGDRLRFTGQGQKRLNEIRRSLRELSGSGLTNEQISARVTELTDEIRDVLSTEVVPHGHGSQDDGKPSDEAGRDPQPEDDQDPADDETTPDDESPSDEPDTTSPETTPSHTETQPAPSPGAGTTTTPRSGSTTGTTTTPAP